MIGVNSTKFFIIALIPLILSIGIAPILSFSYVPNSPRHQLETETALHEITCSPGKVLMVSATGKPGCAWEESAVKLEKYGWGTVVERDTTTPVMTEKKDDRPNILYIILDDTGFSDLSIKGGVVPTPAIDSLIADGTLLDNYRVASACSPTRSMLLTSVDTHLNGIGTMSEAITPNQKGKPGYETYLNDNVVTVATLLQDAGYHTILSGKWHLGVEHPFQPSDRGFEDSFSLLEGGSNQFSHRKIVYNQSTHFVLDGKEVTLPGDFYSSNSYTDYMIEQITEEQQGEDKPMFMYMAFTATHDPLMAPQEYIKKYEGMFEEGYEKAREVKLQTQIDLGIYPEDTPLIPLNPVNTPWDSLNATEKAKQVKQMQVFAAMLDLMDENIGRLLDHLKETGDYDNTLIYLASDNGAMPVSIEDKKGFQSGDDPEKFVDYIQTFDLSVENMGNENSWVSLGSDWAQTSTTPLYGFKLTTSEGGMHVPAVMKLPHQTEAKTIDAFLTVKEIAPTVLDYAGVEHPGTSYKGKDVYPMEGKSMRPLFEGDVDRIHQADEPWAFELFDDKVVYLDNWMLSYVLPPYGDGEWHLYDLSADPTQSYDLQHEYPDLFNEMKGHYDDYAKRTGVVAPIGAGINVG